MQEEETLAEMEKETMEVTEEETVEAIVRIVEDIYGKQA